MESKKCQWWVTENYFTDQLRVQSVPPNMNTPVSGPYDSEELAKAAMAIEQERRNRVKAHCDPISTSNPPAPQDIKNHPEYVKVLRELEDVHKERARLKKELEDTKRELEVVRKELEEIRKVMPAGWQSENRTTLCMVKTLKSCHDNYKEATDIWERRAIQAEAEVNLLRACNRLRF